MRLLFCLLIAIPGIAGEFTTVIGGPFTDIVSAIATDTAGNTYAVGTRRVTVTQTTFDVFVTKLDPGGKVLFTRIFAAKSPNLAAALAVDRAGDIYVAGTTTAADFPLVRPLQTRIFAGDPVNGVPVGSGFVVKLSGDGGTVRYATFFGGTEGQSAINALAADASSNLYVTGYTQAADFPITAGMPSGKIAQEPATPGAILASISANGDRILYSGVIAMATPCATTCIAAGAVYYAGVGIAVDATGNAYVAGNDPSETNLPTTPGAFLPAGNGAFVAKVNAGGTGLGYLTYLGAGKVGTSPFFSPMNVLLGIAADAAGNAYLAGTTFDPKFPATPGAFQVVSSFPGLTTGFLAKLNPAGSALVWATHLAGGLPKSLAVGAGGNVWATGITFANSFPNANGWTTGEEFLAELNAAGSDLTYSALYPSGTIAQAVAVEPAGLVHVAGSAGFVSVISSAKPPGMKVFFLQNGAGGSIGARVSPAEVISLYGPGIGPALAVEAKPTGGFYPTSLAGVRLTINGIAIPLLYVSANQINGVLPMELPVNAAATLRVVNGGSTSPDYPAWVVASMPEAFGSPAFHPDWTLNSQVNPLPGGSVAAFYVTGWQANFAPLANGEVATTANDICLGNCPASAFAFGPPIFGGGRSVPASVTYAGAAPGLVAGVTQINVRLGTPFSTTSFGVTVKNSTGGSVLRFVWVKP